MNALFGVWIFSGLSSVSSSCDGEVGDALSACQAGTAIGAGIGVTFIFFFWVAFDVILGIIWLVTNKNVRSCPACGTKAKVGVTKCTKCGHDFAETAKRP